MTYLFWVSITNITLGLISLYIILVLLIKYPDKIHGMIVPIRMSAFLIEFFILAYSLNATGVIPDSNMIFIRPAIGLLLLSPGLVSFSQILWNQYRGGI